MSLDQHGVDAVEQSASNPIPTPITRIVEGEVANSKNGTAYAHQAEPARITRIEEGDISYHRKVVAQAGQAQAILQSWMAHIAEKYRLPQGARVDEVGNVVYPEAPQPGVPPQD
jgi:hypothetical protein